MLEPWIREREQIREVLGWHEGRHEGKIIGAVDALRSSGHSDKEIIKMVTKKYNLSEEEVKKYL